MTILRLFQSTPLLAFDVATTIDDHIAFNRYHRSLPRERQKQRNGFIAAFVLAPLVALFICGLARVALGGTNCDLDDVFSSSDRGFVFAKVLIGVLLVGAMGVAIYLLYWRRNIERSLRRVLAARPHIDPNDADLRETISHAFYSTGFSVTCGDFAAFYGWAYLERFDEVDDHIFLTTATDGYMIPKHRLMPSTILDIRDLMGQVRPRDAAPLRTRCRSGRRQPPDSAISKLGMGSSSEPKSPGPWE